MRSNRSRYVHIRPRARRREKPSPRSRWSAVLGWASAHSGVVQILTLLVAVFGLWAVYIQVQRQAKAEERAAEDQKKAMHYQAWQTISSAYGKPGSGGRIQALEQLNADGVSLAGADVAGAWLDSLNLRGAFLRGANFQGAHMVGAWLDSANLSYARLDGAMLIGASLVGARLDDASLEGAVLGVSRLEGASFLDANLDGAYLEGTDLRRSRLARAKLRRARVGTMIEYPGTDSASIWVARLDSVILKLACLDSALFYGAVLDSADLSDATARHSEFVGSSLEGVSLRGVDVSGASFAGSDLTAADLERIRGWRAIRDLRGTNLYGVVNAPVGFVPWGVDTMGAVQMENRELWKATLDSLLESILAERTRKQ